MGDAVVGLDWDAGNRKKCQKHGVTLEEIEATKGVGERIPRSRSFGG
jgi:hypothetical protein